MCVTSLLITPLLYARLFAYINSNFTDSTHALTRALMAINKHLNIMNEELFTKRTYKSTTTYFLST